METNRCLAPLSEQQLLQRFGDLVRRDRTNTAQLLVHIAEIDERKLWAKHACSSMFAFCMERFHMSESMTAKRIWAARTARRFPMILPMVARGELHLSGINQLSKHLTEDNHQALLLRAKHKSSREIDILVAEFVPRPDAPSRIRALPRSTRAVVSAEANSERAREAWGPNEQCVSRRLQATVGAPGSARVASEWMDAAPKTASVASELTADAPKSAGVASKWATSTPKSAGVASELAAAAPKSAGVASKWAADSSEPTAGLSQSANGASKSIAVHKQLVALAPQRFKIEITVDQCTHDRLRSLQDLLRHQFPNADPAMIVSRAIELLFDETLKKKAAVNRHARANGKPSTKRARSRRTRAIPAAIRREVWKRDVGRCAFVDEYGRRCRATSRIEYHHETPYGKGGQHSLENIALRCRAHNRYQAELDYGREFMRGAPYQKTGSSIRSHC